MEVEFRCPTPHDQLMLSANLRPDDWMECQDYGFETPSDAVLESVKISDECLCCLIDGEVLAIFGVVRVSHLTGTGSLWLLTSGLVDSHRKTFVKLSKECLRLLLLSWARLTVGIGSRHGSALRFAYRLGWRPGETITYEPTGQPLTLHSIGG